MATNQITHFQQEPIVRAQDIGMQFLFLNHPPFVYLMPEEGIPILFPIDTLQKTKPKPKCLVAPQAANGQQGLFQNLRVSLSPMRYHLLSVSEG